MLFRSSKVDWVSSPKDVDSAVADFESKQARICLRRGSGRGLGSVRASSWRDWRGRSGSSSRVFLGRGMVEVGGVPVWCRGGEGGAGWKCAGSDGSDDLLELKLCGNGDVILVGQRGALDARETLGEPHRCL